jgi:hypothetical protein
VYRQSDPRGIENLNALGQILYLSADKGTQKKKSKDGVMERTAGSQKGFPPRKTSVAKVQHA